MGDPGDITRLMARWSRGDEAAFESLLELVYDDLRHLARRHLARGSGDAVLDTTALVHEAYLRLDRVEGGEWPGRAQFFAFCSKAMRRILIDFARRQQAEKRGGSRIRVTLHPGIASHDADVTQLLTIEDALRRLEAHNPRMARIVECRFFAGMSVAQTAEALDVSRRTVEREWARARAYLQHALADQERER